MMNSNLKYEWSQKVILLVEDEEICHLFFQAALRKTNVQLLIATDGMEAISVVEHHPEINLILMDIRLPELNGVEATKQIKMIRPNVPVIAQTAYAMNHEREMVLNAGFDDYMSKPIIIETMMEKIDRFFAVN